MPKLKVTNTSKQPVFRLSYRFEPNETEEVEVSSREYLTIKSVRALDVEVLEEDTEDENDDNLSEEELKQQVHDSNIDEVMDMVYAGNLTISQALEFEKNGKNRSTLIDQLEEYQAQAGGAGEA